MYRHDGRSLGGDGSLYLVGIHTSCFPINIYEDGLNAIPPQSVGGGHETIGCGDDFSCDSQSLQGCNQRKGAVREKAHIRNF